MLKTGQAIVSPHPQSPEFACSGHSKKDSAASDRRGRQTRKEVSASTDEINHGLCSDGIGDYRRIAPHGLGIEAKFTSRIIDS